MPLKPIRSIAIIGAGPSGLAAAKYLIAEQAFTTIDIFEQRSTTGGVWNHTSSTIDPTFQISRQTPRNLPEVSPFVSPVYDALETNIPSSLMSYTDHSFPLDSSIFPHHSIVLQYLQKYGEELKSYIEFETQILDVVKPKLPESPWTVQVKHLPTEKVSEREYDAVVVASGHYSEPFVPDIPGIAEFNEAYPDVLIHSKFYRAPEAYTNKKVIVVGGLASGIDISIQISEVAQLPVLISEKAKYSPAQASHSSSWSRHVPEITEFLVPDRAVKFADGSIEKDIDAVVFCTGYHYSIPFLTHLNPPVLVPDGSYVDRLWQHLLYIDDPTLAFLCIPQRIVPFPVAESQSAVVARMWSGRLQTPSASEMSKWSETLQQERGDSKARHIFGYPLDVDYINYLHKLSLGARPAPELNLQNSGIGKIPPYWGEELAWVRERIAHIKLASRRLGSKRKEVKSLSQLGFDFKP